MGEPMSSIVFLIAILRSMGLCWLILISISITKLIRTVYRYIWWKIINVQFLIVVDGFMTVV